MDGHTRSPVESSSRSSNSDRYLERLKGQDREVECFCTRFGFLVFGLMEGDTRARGGTRGKP